jgi:hypothetical protein
MALLGLRTKPISKRYKQTVVILKQFYMFRYNIFQMIYF